MMIRVTTFVLWLWSRFFYHVFEPTLLKALAGCREKMDFWTMVNYEKNLPITRLGECISV